MENEERTTPPQTPEAPPSPQEPEIPQPAPPDLDLQPRPKVKRLNRLAILLVAIVAILVLWAAYFVLSTRTPIGRPEGEASRPALQQQGLAVERLRQSALSREEPLEPLFKPRPVPAPPPQSISPTGTASGSQIDRSRVRLGRAYEADVLVSAFASSRPAIAAGGKLPASSLDQLALPPAGPVTESLDTASRAAPEDYANASGGGDPNLLARKDEFLRRVREAERPTHLPSTVREPLSPYEIRQGTLLPAILTTGINSDLPGQTQALIRRDVYDSVTGRHLLIPQGSRLIGEYDNRIAWGQRRVLLAWNRLIFPDGRSLDLRGMPGADLAAMAGVRDRVNNHFVRTFGSALLLSAITAGVQLSQPRESSFGAVPSASQIAAAALGQEIGRVTAEITRRNVNLQPTLEIRPGYLFNVEVTADMILPGPYAPVPTLP